MSMGLYFFILLWCVYVTFIFHEYIKKTKTKKNKKKNKKKKQKKKTKKKEKEHYLHYYDNNICQNSPVRTYNDIFCNGWHNLS